MAGTSALGASKSPAARLAGFIARYDPAVARLARATRAGMRRRFPTALELVYDNYQFLAIGYGAPDRASDCIVSLAVSPKGPSASSTERPCPIREVFWRARADRRGFSGLRAHPRWKSRLSWPCCAPRHPGHGRP